MKFKVRTPKTLMRKFLTKAFSSSSSVTPILQPPCHNGSLRLPLFPPPIPPNLGQIPHISSISRWVFTNSVPPPEWVQPFIDVSDLITDPKNLQPSPWVRQILNLLENSPSMEHNLETYCRRFLIKLSPSFVAFMLCSEPLRDRFDVALRFFHWAGKEYKDLCSNS